jgi:hypothetical protein
MELADETGDINLARSVLWARGHTLLLGLGDITAIPDLARAGCRHARQAQSTHWEQINLVALGTGHLLTGSLDDAETAPF